MGSWRGVEREARREARLEAGSERRGEAASAGLLLVAASSAILPGGQVHPPIYKYKQVNKTIYIDQEV